VPSGRILRELPARYARFAATPRINARRFRGAPGSAFLYTIPATATGRWRSVRQFAAGLKLDAATGHITGELDSKGLILSCCGDQCAGAARKISYRCGRPDCADAPMVE